MVYFNHTMCVWAVESQDPYKRIHWSRPWTEIVSSVLDLSTCLSHKDSAEEEVGKRWKGIQSPCPGEGQHPEPCWADVCWDFVWVHQTGLFTFSEIWKKTHTTILHKFSSSTSIFSFVVIQRGDNEDANVHNGGGIFLGSHSKHRHLGATYCLSTLPPHCCWRGSAGCPVAVEVLCFFIDCLRIVP